MKNKKLIFLSLFSIVPLIGTTSILTSCSGVSKPPISEVILGENFFTNEKDALTYYNKLIYRMGENYVPDLTDADTKIKNYVVKDYNRFVEQGAFPTPITIENIVSVGSLKMNRHNLPGKQSRKSMGYKNIDNIIYSVYEFEQEYVSDFYYEAEVIIKRPDNGKNQPWPGRIEKQTIKTKINILWGK